MPLKHDKHSRQIPRIIGKYKKARVNPLNFKRLFIKGLVA